MSLKIKTPPASEPISLAETKTYLDVTDSADDALIASLITAVRMTCEAWTGRALASQTWTLWLDGFPPGEKSGAPADGAYDLPVNHFDQGKRIIEIPRPPLQSVTHLKIYDTADAAATFSSSNYFVDTVSEPGRFALNNSAVWPTTALRPVNGVEIEFVAGYGAAVDVPDALKQGLLLWIKLLYSDKAWLFETDRSVPGLIELNRHQVPPQVASLWLAYRLMKF